MLCIIKARYIKFLICSNRNIANRTRGFTKIVNKKVLKVIQQASDMQPFEQFAQKSVLTFFIKSSTLSISFSTFCQHCQIAKN